MTTKNTATAKKKVVKVAKPIDETVSEQFSEIICEIQQSIFRMANSIDIQEFFQLEEEYHEYLDICLKLDLQEWEKQVIIEFYETVMLQIELEGKFEVEKIKSLTDEAFAWFDKKDYGNTLKVIEQLKEKFSAEQIPEALELEQKIINAKKSGGLPDWMDVGQGDISF